MAYMHLNGFGDGAGEIANTNAALLQAKAAFDAYNLSHTIRDQNGNDMRPDPTRIYLSSSDLAKAKLNPDVYLALPNLSVPDRYYLLDAKLNMLLQRQVTPVSVAAPVRAPAPSVQSTLQPPDKTIMPVTAGASNGGGDYAVGGAEGYGGLLPTASTTHQTMVAAAPTSSGAGGILLALAAAAGLFFSGG